MFSNEFQTFFEKVPAILPHFVGTFSIDNFPKRLKNRNFFVCNLSPSKEIGSHWITIIKSEPRLIEIFDSLGTKLNVLQPYLHFRGKPKFVFNEGAFQEISSISCGHFAVMFAIERCMNFDMEFKELLAEIFSVDPKINEKIVLDFVNQL
jgi:hypothetical protein